MIVNTLVTDDFVIKRDERGSASGLALSALPSCTPAAGTVPAVVSVRANHDHRVAVA